jgi:hypothetical protein
MSFKAGPPRLTNGTTLRRSRRNEGVAGNDSPPRESLASDVRSVALVAYCLGQEKDGRT